MGENSETLRQGMASSPDSHGGWDHARYVVAKVTTGHKISLKGFRMKDGKLVRNEARLPVNIRLKHKKCRNAFE